MLLETHLVFDFVLFFILYNKDAIHSLYSMSELILVFLGMSWLIAWLFAFVNKLWHQEAPHGTMHFGFMGHLLRSSKQALFSTSPWDRKPCHPLMVSVFILILILYLRWRLHGFNLSVPPMKVTCDQLVCNAARTMSIPSKVLGLSHTYGNNLLPNVSSLLVCKRPERRSPLRLTAIMFALLPLLTMVKEELSYGFPQLSHLDGMEKHLQDLSVKWRKSCILKQKFSLFLWTSPPLSFSVLLLMDPIVVIQHLLSKLGGNIYKLFVDAFAILVTL